MKKFKAMLAATAAVMALSAVSVPMSAFAQDMELGPEMYVFDGNTHVEQWTPGEKPGQKLSVDDGGPSTPVRVDFSIEPTYTVTIPADVHFTDNEREKNAQVKVENVFLAPNNYVVVTVASRNYYNMLLGGTNSEYNIPYTLQQKVKQGEDAVLRPLDKFGEDRLVAAVPTGTQNNKRSETVNLVYAIENEYDVRVAGSYSDILTFTIAVVDDLTGNTGTGNGD